MNVIIINRTAEEALQTAPTMSLCPGSGVVMPARGPLFIPAWLKGEAWLRPVVVLRLSRLGKNVERKFASRYYDAMAAGVLMRPTADEGVPAELASAADSAMALGTWMPLQPERPLTLSVESPATTLTLTRQEVAADDAIVALSRFMTLRMGDLLVPVLPDIKFTAQRDSVLKISLNSIPSLEVKIK